MKTSRSHLRRGMQAIEFALVLPVLVTITGGVVDYSWFFSERQTVLAAARDGARAGAIVDSDYELNPCAVAETGAIEALAVNGITATAAEVTTNTVNLSGGDLAIEVEIDLPYTAIMGLFPTPERQVVRSVQRLEDQLNTGC